MILKKSDLKMTNMFTWSESLIISLPKKVNYIIKFKFTHPNWQKKKKRAPIQQQYKEEGFPIT